jgi:glycine/D-amino acid oxidase-like deaminating enzyme
MTAPGEPADAGRAGDELLDVVVIGASQAGLAMAWHLARHHLRFTVLEAGPEIGHTWRSRWDSLTLFTPAQYDALPGMPFPGPPDTYPAKDPVVGYLKAYAAAFDLPVRLNARVTELSRTAEGFEIRTGDGVLRARQVVVATGPFQVPFTPPAAQRLDGPVTQLHSAGYRNPRALPPGPVLERRGARYTEQRVVERGKVITAAGVSAGIDMALTLLARLHGPELAQGLQLAIEYDPQPPFDTGSPSKAPAEIVEFVRSQLNTLAAANPATSG